MKIVVTLDRTNTSGQFEQDVFPDATDWIALSNSLEIRKDNEEIALYPNGAWLSVKKID